MTFFRFLKKHKKKTIFIGIVLCLIGWGVWSMRPKPPVYDYAEVARRDIIQEVSVTGRVTPASDVSLAFQAGGRVSKTYVKVGDTVRAGDTLAELQTSDLRANLSQANAAVDAARATLNQLQNGTRPEQIDVQKVVVANAMTAYQNAQKGVITTIADAYTKTDDVIRNKVDRYFLNPKGLSPQLDFSLNDIQSQTFIETNRVDLEKMLATWKNENASLQISYDPAIVVSAKNHLVTTRVYLDTLAGALTTAIPSASVTQTLIDAYKTDISAGRTLINTALSSLETETDALSTAKANVDLQNSNLALAEAPTLPETINAQIAVVEQAKANVLSIEANLQKTILRSPIDGVITTQDAKAGQIVTAGVSVVSIISKDKLLIEAYIPEADIAKITLGDGATVTLDAYGDTVKFTAIAMSVDPAETMIEGVATYKMKFQFNENDDKIKPGMTANIDIRTAKNDGVLALPQRVIIRKDNGTFVQILENEEIKEIPVTAGLRGSDGNTEILGGLTEGQKVVVPKN
jgi:multidrug efflux pump subunit AcrA (membrane-fusion protein)